MCGGKILIVSELPVQNSEIETYLMKGNVIQNSYKIIYKHINIYIMYYICFIQTEIRRVTLDSNLDYILFLPQDIYLSK